MKSLGGSYIFVFLTSINFLNVAVADEAKSPAWTCSGPQSCQEVNSQDLGSLTTFFSDGLSERPALLTEKELSTVEKELGFTSSSAPSMLDFEEKWNQKNPKEELPLKYSQPFMKYRLKLNVDDRNIDYSNANQNALFGVNGAEDRNPHHVNVQIEDKTRVLHKSHQSPTGPRDSQ